MSNEIIEETKKEVAWNLSQALLIEIGSLLTVANRLWLSGDVINAFYRLKALKMRVIQNLDTFERQKFREMEFAFEKERFKSEPKGNEDRKFREGNVIYEEYNESLMDVLQKYGYCVKEKEDKTILKT